MPTDSFSREYKGPYNRMVVVESLVPNPTAIFPEGTVVYDRSTAQFYRLSGEWIQLPKGPKGDPGDLIAVDLAADGSTDDTAALQAAVDEASMFGRAIMLPPGVILVSSINITGNLTMFGQGMGLTTLKTSGGNTLQRLGTGTTYRNIHLSDFTLDGGDVAFSSPLVMEWVEDVVVERVEVKNFTGWGMSFGATTNGLDTNYRARRITVRDCYYHDPTAGNTLEALLIFNAKTVTVDNCRFENATAVSDTNAIGIYQIADEITVSKCLLDGWARGVYYSVSTNGILVEGCTFLDNIAGLTGANESDNGKFGFDVVRNLQVRDCTFRGNTVAATVGAVLGGSVTGCLFDENVDNALVIDDGNTPISQPCQHILIENTTFVNNNQSATFHSLHPGILVQSKAHSDITIADCRFYDDQGTPTQWVPISFVGDFTFQRVTIRGSYLRSYSSSDPIILADSAVLGDGCQSIGNTILPGGATVPAVMSNVRMEAGNLFARTNTATQVGLGALGPGGQAAVQLGSAGLRKIYDGGTGTIGVSTADSVVNAVFDVPASDAHTGFWLCWRDGAVLKTVRVRVGATNSAGTGFRTLQIEN